MSSGAYSSWQALARSRERLAPRQGERRFCQASATGMRRCFADVGLNQALERNVGTCRPDVRREKLKWRTHESESTEAGHRGGTTRSSEEVP